MKNNKAININGDLLHEIGMRLDSHYPGVISTLKYPMSRIGHYFADKTLLIEIPAFLAIELYRNGTIPQNKDNPVTVNLDGVPLGSFLIQEVIYPKDTSKNTIQFKFTKLCDLELPV